MKQDCRKISGNSPPSLTPGDLTLDQWVSELLGTSDPGPHGSHLKQHVSDRERQRAGRADPLDQTISREQTANWIIGSERGRKCAAFVPVCVCARGGLQLM